VASSGQRSGPPRIAVVVHGDPLNPRTWSGSPAGICSGLTAWGAEVVPIDARPPGALKLVRLLRRSWTWEATNPAFAAASGTWADRQLRRAGRLDGVVAIGSGYLLKTAVPTVTFEDETVAQALRQASSPLLALPPRAARRWQERQRNTYLRSRACCVGTDWAAGSVRDDYEIDADKVRVVGFGRNLDPLPAERDWSTPRFLFLGVDWELKRGPAVLAAFAEVRARHPEARLDVAGEHPPLDAAGVSGHGRLALGSPPERRRLAELLSRATCLVVPSTREAFGIAYVDAAAAGLPSIGTTVGGAAETIGDGGRTVAPGDHAGLVAAMLELADPDTARRLGERARERSALFTWRAVSERVLRALAPAGVDPDSLAEFLGRPAETGPEAT
jgi:glycosyltransferase involved in cell wall biosynthesis